MSSCSMACRYALNRRVGLQRQDVAQILFYSEFHHITGMAFFIFSPFSLSSILIRMRLLPQKRVRLYHHNLTLKLVIPLGFEPKTHALEGRCSNPTELRNQTECKSNNFHRNFQIFGSFLLLNFFFQSQTSILQQLSLETGRKSSPRYSNSKLAPRADGNWLRKSTS